MDTEELAKQLGARLIARRNAFAIQTPDKGYARRTPRKGIMVLSDLTRHLESNWSIGHYLIDPGEKSFCKLFAFDIDPDKGPARDAALAGDPEIWERMLVLAHGLCQFAHRTTGSKAMVSYGGGKGIHVVAPFLKKTDPLIAIQAAELILQKGGFEVSKGANFWTSDKWSDLTLEVFPKQAEVEGDGFGNLMRLPLGTNAVTGNRAYFVPQDATALGHEDDPMKTLTLGTIR